MSAKHTPGPWVAHYLEIWDVPANKDGAIRIAKVEGDIDNMMNPVALADARLIAAAPDLFAALKRLQTIVQTWNREDPQLMYGTGPALIATAAAITKAGG